MATQTPIRSQQDLIAFERTVMDKKDISLEQWKAMNKRIVFEKEPAGVAGRPYWKFPGMEGEHVFRCTEPSPVPGTLAIRLHSPDGMVYQSAFISKRAATEVQWYLGDHPVYLKVKEMAWLGMTVNPDTGHIGICTCEVCTRSRTEVGQ